MDVEKKKFEIALALLPGVSNVMVKRLVDKLGSAETVFQLSANQWVEQFNIKSKILFEALQKPRETYLIEAQQEINRAKALNIDLVFYTDSNYPERLKNIPDAPALLYYKGVSSLNSHKTIGIVGTRRATEYGAKITQELLEGLLPYKPLIMSGLAFGIDIMAHKISLKIGLETVGIMANGLETVYPAAHKDTAKQMCERGGLLSENRFGSIPLKTMFPARNRIIAGLSDAIIVIEAADKGGALITANMGNDYNKEVFAVPGGLNQKYSAGCNELIRANKAQIYTSVNDVIEALNWDLKKKNKLVEPKIDKKEIDLSAFGNDEKQTIETLIKEGELAIDELAWKTGISHNSLASILLSLEFEGLVTALPGKRFRFYGTI
ncbi:MAG: DNA-processing protein DprA [Cytophagales bacterium]